jgi:hypothetical protein
MDLRRLRAGEWIAAVGGGLLLFSLFTAWYGEPALDAWEAFAVNDVLLAIVAVSALALLVITAIERVPAIPLALDALVAIAGKIAVLLVLIRMLAKPSGVSGLDAGVWIALVGSLAIVAGGWIAMRDERLSKDGKPTDLTGVPRADGPRIEQMPAP